jgi:DNA replication protein DnaC
MRKLPHTAAEDILEVIMSRYERASTLLTSNRPGDDWGKLLGDAAAVTGLLDRLLHHAHVLKCGPRSWRTKVHTDLRRTRRRSRTQAVSTPAKWRFGWRRNGRF